MYICLFCFVVRGSNYFTAVVMLLLLFALIITSVIKTNLTVFFNLVIYEKEGVKIVNEYKSRPNCLFKKMCNNFKVLSFRLHIKKTF